MQHLAATIMTFGKMQQEDMDWAILILEDTAC